VGALTPAAIYVFLFNNLEKKGVFELSTPRVIPPASWSNASYASEKKPFENEIETLTKTTTLGMT
jgi:hypothetical protein